LYLPASICIIQFHYDMRYIQRMNEPATNLAGVDLNLLLVFDALMAERSASRAGQRVGLSQPAVSNALGRLRQLFGDELFIKTPAGMAPTPRARRWRDRSASL
jgi:hypothetical protein